MARQGGSSLVLGGCIGACNPVGDEGGVLAGDLFPGEVAGAQGREPAVRWPLSEVAAIGGWHEGVVGAADDVYWDSHCRQQALQHRQLCGVAADVAG